MVASALLLSVVTRVGGPIFEAGRPVSAAVFESGKPAELNDDNLVDGLSTIELPVPIAKVDVNRNVLSVDLKVSEEHFNKGELYSGIAELISFSFERTSNIDQLLLRLVAEDRWLGTRYLLLAADVRREEWSESALEELRNAGDKELPKELRALFRMTETHLWRQGVN